MKNSILFVFIMLVLNGCVTKDGIFENYYGKCSSYYDVNGIAHNKCDKKIVDFKGLFK